MIAADKNAVSSCAAKSQAAYYFIVGKPWRGFQFEPQLFDFPFFASVGLQRINNQTRNVYVGDAGL